MNPRECPCCGKDDGVRDQSADQPKLYKCDHCGESFGDRIMPVQAETRQSRWQEDIGRDSDFGR